MSQAEMGQRAQHREADKQHRWSVQHHVPPPSTGGTVSVPQSSAASNASTGTFRTASNVRRVSGANVYRIDEDEKPYDLTIFAREEQDSEPECDVQFLRMIQHVRVVQSLCTSVHGTIKEHAEPGKKASATTTTADMPDISTCEFFDIAATDTDGKWDFIGFDQRMIKVRMVTPDMGTATGIVEIILDSGADVSCLPYEYSAVGVETQMSGFYRDAAGNPLNVTGTRRAIVQLGDAQFVENFIVGGVTAPLIAVGKLFRSGWSLVHHDSGQTVLTNGVHSVDVYYKRNSLCAAGNVLAIMAGGAPGLESNEHCGFGADLQLELSGDRVENPDTDMAQASEHEDEVAKQFWGEENFPSEFVPGIDFSLDDDLFTDVHGADADGCVRKVTLTDAVANLQGYWVQLSSHVYGIKYIGQEFMDVTQTLPNKGLEFWTTLVLGDDGNWILIEFEQKLEELENPTKHILHAREPRQIITFSYRRPHRPEQLGFVYDDFSPITGDGADGKKVEPMQDAPVETDPAENAEKEKRDSRALEELEVAVDAAQRDVPRPEDVPSVEVSGEVLREDSSVKELRAACRALGLGQSGGKKVMYKRLVSHQNALRLRETG